MQHAGFLYAVILCGRFSLRHGFERSKMKKKEEE